MKAGNITANELLIVGGLLAGAYIIYSAKDIFGGASSAVKNGIQSLSDAASGGINAVSNYAGTVSSNWDYKSIWNYNLLDVITGAQDPVGDLIDVHLNSKSKDPNGANAAAGATQYVSPITGNESFAQLSSPGALSVYSDPVANPIYNGTGLVFTRTSVPSINY